MVALFVRHEEVPGSNPGFPTNHERRAPEGALLRIWKLLICIGLIVETGESRPPPETLSEYLVGSLSTGCLTKPTPSWKTGCLRFTFPSWPFDNFRQPSEHKSVARRPIARAPLSLKHCNTRLNVVETREAPYL